MRILSLNCWSGGVYEPLITFIREVASSHDIFCLQEVNASEVDTHFTTKSGGVFRANLYQELQKVLQEFDHYYAPLVEDDHGIEGTDFGLAMFIRKGLTPSEVADVFVHGTKNHASTDGHHGRTVQYALFEGLVVCNFHGLWNGGGKGDSEDRIAQSERVRALLDRFDLPKVLVGDFNLVPETESFAILKGEDMRDLIQEYGITSTRSSLYEKPVKYADYALVSSELKVTDFQVFLEEVSDHLPLSLEFSF